MRFDESFDDSRRSNNRATLERSELTTPITQDEVQAAPLRRRDLTVGPATWPVRPNQRFVTADRD